MESPGRVKEARDEALKTAKETLDLLRSGKLKKASYLEQQMIKHYRNHRNRARTLSWVLMDYTGVLEPTYSFCKDDIDRYPCESQCDACEKLMHETSVDILTDELNIKKPKDENN